MIISIHALRGEGDGFSTAIELDDNNFNPRPPWGGRQLFALLRFYSKFVISIHALRGEGDHLAPFRAQDK